MRRELSFKDVDAIAFATAKGIADPASTVEYVTEDIGPLLEMLHMWPSGQLSNFRQRLNFNDNSSLVAAFERGHNNWTYPTSRQIGLSRCRSDMLADEDLFTSFLMDAKRAGQQFSNLSNKVAGQLVAAIRELENNIYEHSKAATTGIVAFKAKPNSFEFVVADRGIGVLNSLRNSEFYKDLDDAGVALRLALTEGVSRHGPESGHGNGFRQIFLGLTNMRGELRFRSGNHAITMDGTSPGLARAKIAQRTPIDGFFVSVKCHCDIQ